MAEPIFSEISKLLKYEPETGELTWLERPLEDFSATDGRSAHWHYKTWNTRRAGKPAFTYTAKHGYKSGHLCGSVHYAHRVAWLLHVGEWPKGDIDHVNGNPRDNRISNLRLTTHAENMRNQKRRSTNTSGTTGVTWHKPSKKWRSRIRVDRTVISLGYFHDITAAIEARQEANVKYGFSARHGA
jgi:hypothetical protein